MHTFPRYTWIAAAVVAGVHLGPQMARAADPTILFWSTQGTAVAEAQAIRDVVLKDYGKPVTFSPQDPGPYMTRIQAELKAGSGSITLVGGLHGDLASFPDSLLDVKDAVDTGLFPKGFINLAYLGTGNQKYVPWMQATYLMVANKQALQYLPKGADINAITYDQLAAWGKAMKAATGQPKLGFPAGPKGLMHRFFQGYLLPSYTGAAITEFKSAEAEKMWASFKEMWTSVTPASAGYGFMQEPLLTGEVWVAWDHIARLKDALDQKPNDFVVFPVPAGPKGRAHMPVIAGLGVLKTSNSVDEAKKLIAYMSKPATQVGMMKATGFFPVVNVELPADVAPSVKMLQPVANAQASAKDALPVLLPIGLGDAGGRYNKAFTDTFQRIVLNNQDIRMVLDQEGKNLQAIFDQKAAPCWAPDPVDAGPCKLK
jgi:multiple sugar transport system substrate-binding protein